MNSRVAVLASGGFDSNVLLAELAKKYTAVYPVYIRGGHIWEEAELYWLRRFLKSFRCRRLKPLTVLTVPVTDLYQQGWQVTGRNVPGYRSRDQEVYLPGRNLLLLAKAATFCALRKIPTLALGSLEGNPFSDATHSFFLKMAGVISDALGVRFRIIAPFSKLKKEEVMKKGRGLPLHLSFSCLAPRGLKHCGRCNKCAERDKILTIFENTPQSPASRPGRRSSDSLRGNKDARLPSSEGNKGRGYAGQSKGVSP